MTPETFGQWIKSARSAMGLSLGAAAALASMPSSRLSAIEHDSPHIDPRKFKLTTVEGLARALGMQPWRIVLELYERTGGWHG